MAEINTWPGWECIRVLGSGSYGKVYEIQKQEYGKTYTAALKVITIPKNQADVQSAYSDGLDKDSVTTYFRSIVAKITDEFALMSDLKGYTNIVSYQDHMVVEHENEIGWDILIRMELLTSLQAYCVQKTLTENEILKLGCDICRALELCWDMKIIHRDIKPENIFVNKHGDFELGDFGVARTVENELTTGSLAGTETYMAPEVYWGRKYGHTADIYSLAVVLYRYLNNSRIPFLPMGNILAGDREKAKERRMSGEDIPVPVNGSEQLKQVVLKALSYDPDKRYQSATEFRTALESCYVAEVEPTPTPPPDPRKPDEDDPGTVAVKPHTDVPPVQSPSPIPSEPDNPGTIKVKPPVDVPPVQSPPPTPSEPDNPGTIRVKPPVDVPPVQSPPPTPSEPDNPGTIRVKPPVEMPPSPPKKKIKPFPFVILGVILIMVVAIVIGSGHKPSPTPTSAPAPAEDTISSTDDCNITADSTTVSVGETTDLAFLTDGYIYRSDDALTWTSSDTTVATVSNDGIVTGVSVGTATIMGVFNDLQATIDISVEEAVQDDTGNNNTETPVTSEDLSVNSLEIYCYTTTLLVGDSINTRIKADDWILDGSSSSIKWSTDDSTIASIDNQGILSANSVGTCNLIAEYGGKTASQEIIVVDVDKSSGATVSADYNSLSLSSGGSDVITLTFGGNMPEHFGATVYYTAGISLGFEWGTLEQDTITLTIKELYSAEKEGYATILVFEQGNPDHIVATAKIHVRIN